jgi:hypothetical protein
MLPSQLDLLAGTDLHLNALLLSFAFSPRGLLPHCAGQAWQIRHWPGSSDQLANRVTVRAIKRESMDSIYSRPACSTLP